MPSTPSPLPPFDNDGNIPPGDYRPAQDDFEARFANSNQTRIDLYGGWNSHKIALRSAGVSPASQIIVDGSYTTSKDIPGDIDYVVFVEVPDTPSINQDLQTLVNNIAPLVDENFAKANFGCHPFWVPVLPTHHSHYHAVTEKMTSYWVKWFGKDRLGRQKGRIWSTAGGFV